MISFLSAGFLSAQTNSAPNAPMKHEPNPEQRAKKLTEIMNQYLMLNETEQISVYNINLKYAQMHTDIDQQKLTQEERKNQVLALGAQKDAEFKTVLTSDQYNSYIAKKAEMYEKLKEQHQEKKEMKQQVK
jgi:hypothetical protein